jgi:hypothetical protein
MQITKEEIKRFYFDVKKPTDDFINKKKEVLARPSHVVQYFGRDYGSSMDNLLTQYGFKFLYKDEEANSVYRKSDEIVTVEKENNFWELSIDRHIFDGRGVDSLEQYLGTRTVVH